MRLAPIAHLEERRFQERYVDRVQAGERLVHEQDVRVLEDRGDELDLLLVALREGLGPTVCVVADAEASEPLERVAAGPPARHAVERGEEDELIEDEHPRVEPSFLGHVAPGLPRPIAGRASGPGDGPGVRLQEAEDDAHRGRLAGAVGAEEPEHLAGSDRECDAIERLHIAESLPKVDDLQAHAVTPRLGSASGTTYLDSQPGPRAQPEARGTETMRPRTAAHRDLDPAIEPFVLGTRAQHG